jgi:Flp pilus assembly pilin Flp
VWRKLLRDEAGQDLVEYRLLLAFIGLVGAAVYLSVGSTTGTLWSVVNSRLANANQAGS